MEMKMMKTHLSNVYPTRLCHVLKVLGTPRTPQDRNHQKMFPSYDDNSLIVHDDGIPSRLLEVSM